MKNSINIKKTKTLAVACLSIAVSFSLLACNPIGFNQKSGTKGQGSKEKSLSIYSITGSDEHGSYSGQGEVLVKTDGSMRFIRLQQYDDMDYKGHHVARAVQGQVASIQGDVQMSYSLDPSGYIMEKNGFSRSIPPKPPIEITITGVAKGDEWHLKHASAGGKHSATEVWKKSTVSVPSPIWQNKREITPTHKAPSSLEKTALFAQYKSYHEMDFVKPYVNKPEFQALVHSSVRDTTDYEFYQKVKDVVRVIQKTINPASIHEAYRRKLAYGSKLHEKAAKFEGVMDSSRGSDFFNRFGMYQYANGRHDVDSLLWTGVYVASQTLRYLETKEQVAFDNLMISLKGIITCYEIAGEKGQFARTLRASSFGLADRKWHSGQGRFSGIEWLDGGNNDMVKGFFIGFTSARLAIEAAKNPSYDPLLVKMKNIMAELVENNDEIFNYGQQIGNTGLAKFMLYWMETDPVEKFKHLGEYEAIFEVDKIVMEKSSIYEYGITDWSGNHLHAVGKWTHYMIAQTTGHSNLSEYMEIMRENYDEIGQLPIGFNRQVLATLGWSGNSGPKDYLWELREFMSEKLEEDEIDWRASSSFTLSPLPNLPWKNDYQKGGRFQPLYIYPLFEQGASNYQWKSAPRFQTKPRDKRYPMVDYLVSYWFGRHYGGISAND